MLSHTDLQKRLPKDLIVLSGAFFLSLWALALSSSS